MAVNVTGKRLDPVMSYNFLVTLVDSSSLLTIALSGIQNAVMGGFSECSGLEMALQVEEYREGGSNGTILKFPTRISWANIRLRRGVVASDDLWRWHFSFVEGKGKRRDGTIILQNDAHQPVRVWNFVRGLPVKWTGPAMHAAQNQVAIEELEIAHEGVRPSSPSAALASTIGSLF
jgi:phage tail-like protein